MFNVWIHTILMVSSGIYCASFLFSSCSWYLIAHITIDYAYRGPISSWAYDVRSLRSQNGEVTSRSWPANNGVATVSFEKLNMMIILIRGNFNDVSHWAHAGIAMAGTATEQLVSILVSQFPVYMLSSFFFSPW